MSLVLQVRYQSLAMVLVLRGVDGSGEVEVKVNEVEVVVEINRIKI